MPTEPTVPQQLRRRINKYFLVVFGMMAGLIVTLILLGVGLKLAGAEQKTAGMVMGIVSPLLMLGLVVSSWVAVGKLWRCPKCEKSVYWTVSWNMSIFAGGASGNCPGCGVELFTPASKKRTSRAFLIIVVLAVGAGLLGAVFFAASDSRRPKPTPIEQPKPPG